MITTEESTPGEPLAGASAAQPDAPKPVAPQSARPRRRVREWLWRTTELAAARQAVRQLSGVEAERLARARRALELADRAIDPVDPLRTGSSTGLAISLYREAAFWALLAQNEEWSAPNLGAVFDLVPHELLRLAANGDGQVDQVRGALVSKDFVATAEDGADQQRRDAEAARDFVHALVAVELEPERRVVRLLVQRWTRTLLVALTVIGLSVGGWLVIRELGKGPDLAAGKPWQASSNYAGCSLRERRCGSTSVKVFFHTEEENQPWVQFDLGSATAFARIELVNRSDSGSERGYPVVLEVSDDAKSWREIARREESYSTWRASFAPVRARYVRARLTKRNWFHLERFSVYAP